jgi:subtilisin family serine protease
VRKLLFAVAAFALLAITASAASAPAGAKGRYFVGFGKAPGAAERAVVTRLGGTVKHAFPEASALAVELDSARVSTLAKSGGVRYVEADPVVTPLSLSNSQLVPALDNGLYGLLTTNAVDAHANGYTGAGTKVCVGDTGIDANHVDIRRNLRGGIDTISGDNNPDVGNSAVEDHGTHVAGTALAADNNAGVFGVAFDAQLFHARVLGVQPDGSVSGTSSSVMAGVRWLVEQAGCRIVNLSLGHTASFIRTEQRFYDEMHRDGALVIAASGNSGTSQQKHYPAAYDHVVAVAAVDSANQRASFSNAGSWVDLAGPGVDVLSSVPDGVGFESLVSTNQDFRAFGLEFAGVTSASGITRTLVDCGLGTSDCPAATAGNIALIQRGAVSFAEKVQNAMDAGAAGAIIYNNVPGELSGATLGTPTNAAGAAWIPAVGVSDVSGATLKTQLGQTVTLVNAASSWNHLSGTSMATPHVSGVAGLVLDAEPGLTNVQLESILKSTAQDLGPAGFDTSFGFGLVDADAATQAATP